MKNIGNKLLIFYHFQLEHNKDCNVSALPPTNQPPTIKDVLSALPIDLSHGLYHFRFKSEMPDGDQKTIAWIDINNLLAKVPQVNGAIYMKILQLKDPAHNKLFNIQKLRKADIVKATTQNHSHSHGVHSMPKSNPVSPGPINQTKNPSNANNVPKYPVNVPQVIKTQPPSQQPQTVKPKQQQAKPASVQPQTTSPTINNDPNANFISFEAPAKSKLITTTIQQNLQTFQDQFKRQQEHKENQRLAQYDLQQIIRKWGYTDGKKINNTTTLLATLHEIWPQWDSVSLTDMLKPEQVTALFKKAVIKVHPDKNRNRHFKERYLSKRVFELLNESRKQ